MSEYKDLLKSSSLKEKELFFNDLIEKGRTYVTKIILSLDGGAILLIITASTEKQSDFSLLLKLSLSYFILSIVLMTMAIQLFIAYYVEQQKYWRRIPNELTKKDKEMALTLKTLTDYKIGDEQQAGMRLLNEGEKFYKLSLWLALLGVTAFLLDIWIFP